MSHEQINLIDQLKDYKKQKKTLQEKVHHYAMIATNLSSGVASGYTAASSSATTAGLSPSARAQAGLSITSLATQFTSTIPAMIAIATSDRPIVNKLLKIVPLVLVTSLNVAAGILGILVLFNIVGLLLTLIGSSFALTAAAIGTVFTAYNLLKAIINRTTIGTKFENKVNSVKGIWHYFNALINKESLQPEKTIQEDRGVLLENLKTSLAAENKNFDEIQLLLDKLIQKDQEDRNFLEYEILQNEVVSSISSEQEAALSSLVQKRARANDNIRTSAVNFGLALGGLILAIVGFMGIVSSTAVSPILGSVLGWLGTSIAFFGFAKFLIEFIFAWFESNSAETHYEDKLQGLLQEAGYGTTKAEEPKLPIHPEKEITLENNQETIEMQPAYYNGSLNLFKINDFNKNITDPNHEVHPVQNLEIGINLT